MIVVAGEALIDRMVHADGRVQEAPGGGPFNVARTIARLGGQVAFLGRLSTDERGRRLRAALVADEVDIRFVQATNDPTTLAQATIDANGNATYVFELDGTSAAGLSAENVDAALVERPLAVHVGTLGLVMEPIGSVLAAALPALSDDTLLVLDPNCRPATVTDRAGYRGRIGAFLRRADVVKVSADDLAYLEPGREPEDAARSLLAAGAQVVLLTDGGRAARILTCTFKMTIPVPTMPVVDTIGAGDAFGGGFLAHWIATGRGRAELTDRAALADATRFAILVAGLACGRAGADPPTAAEVAMTQSADGAPPPLP